MKNSLKSIPYSILVGLREALSASLSISITFADETGKEIHINKSKIGRKYIQDVCKYFHYNKDEYEFFYNKCKSWDKEAAKNINNPENVPKECWCKFACFAVPIKNKEGEIEGMILAGERRLDNGNNTPTYIKKIKKECLVLLNSELDYKEKHKKENIIKQYNELLDDSFNPKNLIKKDKYEESKSILETFADILREFIEKDLFNQRKSEENFDEIKKTISEKCNSDVNKLELLLTVFLSGFSIAVTKWLDILDPVAFSTEYRDGKEFNCFVIFIDIRNFTGHCIKLGLDKILALKRKLFGKINDIVLEYSGVVDSFVGDAMVIHFKSNDEDIQDETPKRVVECLNKISNVEIKIDEGTPEETKLNIGIGVTYGEVIYSLDYLPSDVNNKRFDVGIVGSTVNKASKLSNLARKFDSIGQHIIAPAIVVDEEAKKKFYGIKNYKLISLGTAMIGNPNKKYENVFTIVKEKDNSDIGKRYINLSCGALGSPSNRIINALSDYYYKVRAKHKEDSWKEVYLKISDILGCEQDRISFRVNTTTAISSCLFMLRELLLIKNGYKYINNDKILLMSTSEHPMSTDIAKLLFNKSNIDNFSIDNLVIEYEKKNLRNWFKEKYSDIPLLLFPHVTWGRGTILPYNQISEDWKKSNKDIDKYVIIDGAHSLGHIPICLEPDSSPALVNFDFYVTCGHKWLAGPHGTGIIYTSQKMLEMKDVKRRIKYLDSFTERQISSQTATGQRAIAYGLREACLEFCENDKGEELDKISDNTNYDKIKKLSTILKDKLEPLFKKGVIKHHKPDMLADANYSGIVSFHIPGIRNYVKFKNDLAANHFIVSYIDDRKDFKAIRICTSYHLEESDLDNFVKTLTSLLKNNKEYI